MVASIALLDHSWGNGLGEGGDKVTWRARYIRQGLISWDKDFEFESRNSSFRSYADRRQLLSFLTEDYEPNIQ